MVCFACTDWDISSSHRTCSVHVNVDRICKAAMECRQSFDLLSKRNENGITFPEKSHFEKLRTERDRAWTISLFPGRTIEQSVAMAVTLRNVERMRLELMWKIIRWFQSVFSFWTKENEVDSLHMLIRRNSIAVGYADIQVLISNINQTFQNPQTVWLEANHVGSRHRKLRSCVLC